MGGEGRDGRRRGRTTSIAKYDRVVQYRLAEQCKQLFDTSIQWAVRAGRHSVIYMLRYDIILHENTENGFVV